MPDTAERFVAVAGPHAGNEVEFVRETNGGVVVKALGGGDAWKKGKSPGSGLYHLTQGVFDKNYRPRDSLTTVPVKTAGRAFRRKRAEQNGTQMTLQAAEVKLVDRSIVSPNVGHLAISVEMVTPDMARAWLERSEGQVINRPLSRQRVIQYAAAIRRGEWQLTGDSIKLDSEGRIRDGQNRLTAVVESGIPIQSLVVRNVTEEAFDVMDSGKGRGAPDVIAMHGLPNRFATAAVARTLLLIERYGRPEPKSLFSHPEWVPSAVEQVRYVEAHRDEITLGLHHAERVRKIRFNGGLGLWGSVFVLLMRTDKLALELFADSLVSGANLPKNSPILRLRNLAMNPRNSQQSKAGREILMAIIIKCWNAWRLGQDIGTPYFRTEGRNAEDFPVPV